MKTPSNSTKISKAWLEFILTENESKQHPGAVVSVSDFAVNQGIPPGEGFNSELVLVDVTAKVWTQAPEGDGQQEEKTYHFAAKFLHRNPISAEFIRRFKGHTKEYLMYSSVIHELNVFQAASDPDAPRIMIPELIYGKDKGSEYVLVMENLKAVGYDTNDKRKGLDFEHTMEAFRQLARVHAVSYAYDKSNNFLEKYPCFEYKEFLVHMFKAFLLNSVDSGIKYLRSLKDREELAQKIEKSKPRLLEKLEASMKDHGDILCLNHGDFWNSNIMYKYHQSLNGEPPKIAGSKIIDWGNTFWATPAFDIHYLLNTSTTAALRKNHLEEILQAYHSLFTSVTAKLGAPLPHWTYEAFRADFDRRAAFGFASGLMLIQGTLSTSNPANKTPEPSVLDHPILAPVRALVRGLQILMAKAIGPLFEGESGMKLMGKFAGLILKPIMTEILSGKNEVLNKRLLEHLCEADEKGIFD